MKIRDVINEAFWKPKSKNTPQTGFASGPQQGTPNVWKNNRNPEAPAGATPAQASQQAGVTPTPAKNTGISPSVQNKAGDIVDAAKGALYRFTGLGGKQGSVAAGRTKFINDFKQEMTLAQRSARQGGIPFDPANYAQAYLKRYNLQATPAQLTSLNNITDPTQMANALYLIGKQSYTGDERSGGYYRNAQTTQGGTQGGPATQANQQVNKDDTVVSPQTKRIVATIRNMKGPMYEEDLKQIAKVTLWSLWGTDKQDYAELINSLMANKTKAPNPSAPATSSTPVAQNQPTQQ